MIFHDHIDLHLICVFAKAPDPFCGQFHLFIPGTCAAGIHPDRMAIQEFGRFYPSVMVSDSLFAAFLVRVTQVAFCINHDQLVLHSFTVTSVFQFAEEPGFFDLLEIEGIDEFKAFYAEFITRDTGEIDRISFAIRISLGRPPFKIPVQGPLCQRDGEEYPAPASAGIKHPGHQSNCG